jgi:alkanesulfonate monooxygenase SsuD/methylene tetrahydromethanopterin reductase-like flavin-dependent oxidoreductase (luciferase family)
MRYGVLNFGIAPYERLARRWRTFEELGFDSAWITDELLVPGYADFESWALLAALARETSRMRIGTLISTVRLRHPAFLAAQVITVDHVSGGRAALGIGAGEPYQNASVGNAPWSAVETLERLDEQAAILSALLRGDSIAHDGPHYPTIVEVMPAPVSRPRPPLVIAAHGAMGLRATARYADGWNCLGGQVYHGGPKPDPSQLRSLTEAAAETGRLLGRLDEACVAVGRDPASVARSVLAYRPLVDPFASVGAFDDFVGAYSAFHLDEITFYWPPLDQAFADPPSPADEARFERIAAQRIASRPARPDDVDGESRGRTTT